jgi:hypothetical protein
VEVLEAQVESMSNKLCHCGQESPVFEEDCHGNNFSYLFSLPFSP